MRILILMVMLCSSNAGAASVGLSAKVEAVDKTLVLNVTLKNEGKEDVYLATLSGKLIHLRLDLWSLGKGIELHSKDDAAWRRAHAFIDMVWKPLKPGEVRKVTLDLQDMMASNPDDDAFARSIVKEVVFLKRGRACVSVETKHGDPESPDVDETQCIVEMPE
jgi:hypothetical protein